MKISKSHLVWVNLVLLAAAAYFGAATVSGAIAAKMTPPLTVALHSPPPPIERAANRPPSYYDVIQKRDVFNPAKPPEVQNTPEPAKPTELRLKLWGVVVHHGDAEGSYAVIEDLSNRRQDLYRVNDMVASAATIKRVEWDRVILDRSGSEEILQLEQPSALPGGVPAVNVASAVAPMPGAPRAAGARPGAPGASAPGATADASGSGSIQ